MLFPWHMVVLFFFYHSLNASLYAPRQTAPDMTPLDFHMQKIYLYSKTFPISSICCWGGGGGAQGHLVLKV